MANLEEDFSNDPIREIKEDPLKKVSDMHIFELGRNILVCIFILYICIVLLFAFSDHLEIKDPMSKVWDFSSQGLFGIVNLILGFYFGGKINKA